ncbi:MAG TPA: hypothetical protein VGM91_05305 [Conexibacter sp.]|jgi:hypothetical protein
MTERRWPLVVAAVVAALAIAGAAWAGSQAVSAPQTPAGGHENVGVAGAVRTIDGVAVGVQRSRAGALAAADNYVARVTETIVQDRAAYARLVRIVWVPEGQDGALREGESIRERSAAAVENYATGGRGLAIVAARRLDTYDGTRAEITTWTAGFNWGPQQRPGQRWFLTETTLRWDGQRWRVEAMDEAHRPAPAPARVGYTDSASLETDTFDRELRGMTAPTYGDD